MKKLLLSLILLQGFLGFSEEGLKSDWFPLLQMGVISRETSTPYLLEIDEYILENFATISFARDLDGYVYRQVFITELDGDYPVSFSDDSNYVFYNFSGDKPGLTDMVNIQIVVNPLKVKYCSHTLPYNGPDVAYPILR